MSMYFHWWDFVSFEPVQVCICFRCFYEFIYVSVLLYLEDAAFLMSSTVLAVATIPLPAVHRFLNIEGRGLIETIHVRLSASEFLSLFTLSFLKMIPGQLAWKAKCSSKRIFLLLLTFKWADIKAESRLVIHGTWGMNCEWQWAI